MSETNGGRKAYVEFVPGQQGVQGSYAAINKFLSKDQYEKAKASGVVPSASQSNGGAPRSAPPAVQSVIPAAPSAASGPVVQTVAPAPAGGLRLPPPPAVNVAR